MRRTHFENKYQKQLIYQSIQTYSLLQYLYLINFLHLFHRIFIILIEIYIIFLFIIIIKNILHISLSLLEAIDWPVPQSIKDVRAFVGIVVYYRIFIACFSIIAASLFELFRKGVRFSWTSERQHAMDELKRTISQVWILISLDFSLSALLIVFHVDAFTSIGWGAILSQLQSNGELHPA